MDGKSIHKDYYYILGISADATSEEVQEAYHDLYEKYGPHISVSGHDPEMLLKTFRDISEAYEVLMDPAKRSEYDKNFQPHMSKGDLRALWTKYAGVTAREETRVKKRAAEMEVEIEVTLKEAMKGTRKTLRIEEPKPCEDCVGMKPVQRMQCPNCRGLGYTTTDRQEEIELPSGMYEKMVVRIPDLGKFDLQAGRRGELVVSIKLNPHPFLTVLGRDLTCTVPVSTYEAVLGAEIEVPTATGKVIMKIQPRTQTGRVYRLKGLGLAGADQLVSVEVLTPQQLSEEEVSLYHRLREMSKDPNPRDAIWSKLQSAAL